MVSTIFCWPDPNLCWLSEVTTFRRLNPIKISMLLKSHSLWLNHHFLLQKIGEMQVYYHSQVPGFLGIPIIRSPTIEPSPPGRSWYFWRDRCWALPLRHCCHWGRAGELCVYGNVIGKKPWERNRDRISRWL